MYRGNKYAKYKDLTIFTYFENLAVMLRNRSVGSLFLQSTLGRVPVNLNKGRWIYIQSNFLAYGPSFWVVQVVLDLLLLKNWRNME